MNYELNLRSLLLFIAMLQGTVVAVMLVRRGLNRRRAADFLLSGLLLTLVMSLISYFGGFMGMYDAAREAGYDLTFFPFGNDFLFGPFLWLYVQAATDREFQLQKKHWWLFASPLLYYVVHFGVWFQTGATKAWLFDQFGSWWFPFEGVAATFIFTYFLVRSVRRMLNYKVLVENEYSDTEALTLNWLRLFLLALSTYFVMNVLFQAASFVVDLGYTGWYWIELLRAVLLYYLSVTGWNFTQRSVVPYAQLASRDEVVASAMESTGEPTTATAASSVGQRVLFNAADLERRRSELARFMEQERPWLDPDLTLSQLAEQVDLNTSQLSFVVNQGFGQNFNDFVNTYRVEAVKQKMNTPDVEHLSLLGVAFECGFNSKATFNRAFKKLTGNVPSEFKRSTTY